MKIGFKFSFLLLIIIFSSFISSCIEDPSEKELDCDRVCPSNLHCVVIEDSDEVNFDCRCNEGFISKRDECIGYDLTLKSYLFVTGETKTNIENDDGNTQRGLQRTYTKNLDINVIKDERTELNWYSSDEVLKSYKEASDFCESIRSDPYRWRLPFIKELLTLVDFKYKPTINPIFDYVSADKYWTNTDFIEENSEKMYLVNFLDGLISFKSKTDFNKVLCVSGAGRSTLGERKHLVWEDSELSKENTKTWKEAIRYCENLDLNGYSDWYLPNINELYSKFDDEFFPKLTYWSSTFNSRTNDIDYIRTLNMSNRVSNMTDSSFEKNVICVRSDNFALYSSGNYGDIVLNENYTIPKDVLFIDIRTEHELESGHPKASIPGAIFKSGEETRFISDIERISINNKEAHIILICSSSGRSRAAAQLLSDNGFRYVEHIIGGTGTWRLLGLPWEDK